MACAFEEDKLQLRVDCASVLETGIVNNAERVYGVVKVLTILPLLLMIHDKGMRDDVVASI
jgi:hypothetical protein